MSGILRIDLERFAANLVRVRSAVAPAELMLVVKDDAYAHGLEPIVRRAHREGVRWIGAFEPCASSTMRMICDSTVASPTAVARKESAPCWLTVPPTSVAPLDFATGTGSPVIMDSST